jgi:hypothetical protein
MRTQAQDSAPGLLSDFRLLLILFIAFRLMMYLAYEPMQIDGVVRGLAAGGDWIYHYDLAALASDDLFPFQDWWSEYPPIWPVLSTAVFLVLGEDGGFGRWALVMTIIMVAAEVGILALIRSLGSILHSPNTGLQLAWVYALLAGPFVAMVWGFDSLVTFALLASVYALVGQRDGRAALLAAFGGLVKFVPLLVLGAVFRFRAVPRALRFSAIVLAVFAAAYALLWSLNAETAVTSLTIQAGKPSYLTVWAIIDGNTSTGIFGSVADHMQPAVLLAPMGHPPVIPGWLRLVVAAGIGLVVYARTRRFDALGLVAFTGITVTIFLLQSQGWSMQWIAYLIPFVLLCYPTRNGVIAVVLLSLLAIAEYPYVFIRTADTGGVVSGRLFMPWVILVLTRTLLLVGIAVAFYQRLRQFPVLEPEGSQ